MVGGRRSRGGADLGPRSDHRSAEGATYGQQMENPRGCHTQALNPSRGLRESIAQIILICRVWLSPVVSSGKPYMACSLLPLAERRGVFREMRIDLKDRGQYFSDWLEMRNGRKLNYRST